MLITPSALNVVFQHFDMSFQAGLTGAPATMTDKIASKFTSNTRENVYPLFAGLPGFRKWAGSRIMNNLRGHAYTIINDSYELSYSLEREVLEDATEGDVRLQFAAMAVKQLGEQAVKHPEDLLVALMQDTAATCYDGLSFWNDAHPENYGQVGSATFDNLFASTALNTTNFDAVYAAMQARNGADGKPLGITPNLLIVPPQLRTAANLVIKAENIVRTAGDGASTNTNKDLVEVLVSPRLANESGTWYLLDTTKVVMPFIWQTRKNVEFVSRTDLASDAVFHNKVFEFGADLRDAVGYTLPQLASRCSA